MENNNAETGKNEIKPPVSPSISPDIKLSAPKLSTGGMENFAVPETAEKKISPSPILVEKLKPIVKKEMPKTAEVKKTDQKMWWVEKKEKNKKLPVIIISAAVGVIIIAAAVYLYLSNFRKISVSIISAQDVITLEVDGKEYSNIKSPYNLKLKPGNYKITASKKGFFPQEKTIDLSGLEKTPEISFDLIEKKNITQIFDKNILYPVYSEETNSLLYFTENENGFSLNEYSLDKREETILTTQSIPPFENAAWSPSLKEVVVKITNSPSNSNDLFPYLEKYGEKAKINWIINLNRGDLVNITTKYLDPAIKNVSFSPQGDKIVYFFQNDLEKTLAVANNDGSNFERIIQLKTLPFDPDVVWSPDGDKIAIYVATGEERESKAGESDVYIYSFSQRNVIKITEDGVSYGALFSPDGQKLLYESSNKIWLYDFSQTEVGGVNTEISSTLEKSVWINGQNIAMLDQEGNLWKVNVSGEKNLFDYKEDLMPENTSKIIKGINKLFFTSPNGVWELEY